MDHSEPTTAEMFMAIGLMLGVYAVIILCLCRVRRCRDMTVYTQMNMTVRERCAYFCLGRTPEDFDDSQYISPAERRRRRDQRLTAHQQETGSSTPVVSQGVQDPPPYPASESPPPAYTVPLPPPLYEEVVHPPPEHTLGEEMPPPYPEQSPDQAPKDRY